MFQNTPMHIQIVHQVVACGVAPDGAKIGMTLFSIFCFLSELEILLRLPDFLKGIAKEISHGFVDSPAAGTDSAIGQKSAKHPPGVAWKSVYDVVVVMGPSRVGVGKSTYQLVKIFELDAVFILRTSGFLLDAAENVQQLLALFRGQ